MQVVINLPNDFVAFQTMEDLKQEVSSSYTLWLYQRGRVTLAKAAELAGPAFTTSWACAKAIRYPSST